MECLFLITMFRNFPTQAATADYFFELFFSGLKLKTQLKMSKYLLIWRNIPPWITQHHNFFRTKTKNFSSKFYRLKIIFIGMNIPEAVNHMTPHRCIDTCSNFLDKNPWWIELPQSSHIVLFDNIFGAENNYKDSVFFDKILYIWV